MKRLLLWLVMLVMIVSVLPCNAQTEYLPMGLQNTQKEYADVISTAIENSEYLEEQIDKEHIFIIENTSPIPMRKNEEPVWLYVALPILGTSDVSFAHFDEGEYVSAITNFVALKNIENPYGEKLQQYMENNNLSEPTAITNMWIIERLHLFAYKVLCNNEEYILPYYFTEDTMFNLTENEDCNIEIGNAYTMDEFLTICENEADLFAEYRKSESEEEKEDKSHTYVDNDGEVVTIKPEKEQKTTETDKVKSEEKLGGGDIVCVPTFAELTKLSAGNVEKISVVCNKGGRTEFSTSSSLIISKIVDTFHDMQFIDVTTEGGGAGGWLYGVNFYMEDGTYIQFGTRIHIDKADYNVVDYDTAIEKMACYYDLMKSIDGSKWATDYILECIELGFLEGITDISYKEPITREKFCEIIYNMLDKTMDIKWQKVSPNPFRDTINEKVFALYHEGIIHGKGDYTFSPNDYLTREAAATILWRMFEKRLC